MKKLIIALILIFLLTGTAYCDKLQVPFSCYPKQLQEVFAGQGIKLDLDGNDRTPESWGFLKNEGAEYYIYTYYAVTEEGLMIVMDLIWEHMNIKEKK